MKTFLVNLGAVCFLTLIALGAFVSPSIAAPPFQGKTVDVTIVDFAFQPATLTVTAGDTVRWTNRGANTHTVTSDTPGLFDSGNIPPGGQFPFPAAVPGTYAYHCSIHQTMKGQVVVQQAATATPTNTLAVTPTASPTVGVTATSTPTLPPTLTPTLVATATRTNTAIATATASVTLTRSATSTRTATGVSTLAPVQTLAPNVTATETPTLTPTPTNTPTNTPCPCVSITPGAPGTNVGGSNASTINTASLILNAVLLVALAGAGIALYNLSRRRRVP